MSVTIEDKVELFSKMIFGKIEAQSSDRRQNLVEKYETELAKVEKEIQAKKAELMKNANIKAERERTRIFAQLQSQQQRRLAECKQKFMNQIMEMLYGYAARLAGREDYKVVLSREIDYVSKGFKNSKRIHFYALPNEIDMVEKLLKENISKFNPDLQYVVEAAPLNILGGLIAKDKENLLEIDMTLKTLVEEYRDTAGAAITRKFNEVSSI